MMTFLQTEVTEYISDIWFHIWEHTKYFIVGLALGLCFCGTFTGCAFYGTHLVYDYYMNTSVSLNVTYDSDDDVCIVELVDKETSMRAMSFCWERHNDYYQ